MVTSLDQRIPFKLVASRLGDFRGNSILVSNQSEMGLQQWDCNKNIPAIISRQLQDLCRMPIVHNGKLPNLAEQSPVWETASWSKFGPESANNQQMGQVD